MNFETYDTDDLKLLIYKISFEGDLCDLTEEDLASLYAEIYKRRLYRPDIVLSLHSWSLYLLGKGPEPRYKLDASGNHWTKETL